MTATTTCTLESPTEAFPGTLLLSQKAPSKAELAKVSGYTVLNAKGVPTTFGALCGSHRTLVVFVRHFFCGNCQEFLRTLSEAFSQSDLDQVTPNTKLVVIGCGSPELIDFYKEESNCSFPLYTDPDRALFKALGMTRTKQPGARPQYQQRSLLSISVESILQGLGRGRKALKGGDFWQVGGEFLIEDGECLWAHRMSTTRDHSEIPEIRKVLGLDGGVTPVRKGSGVIDGVKRRWSRQHSASSEGRGSLDRRPLDLQERIPEIPAMSPRDSGVDVVSVKA